MKIRIENSNAGFTDDVMNIIIENEECKWPNLKQLIEAKTDLKFRIKDEQQSKELQEFLSDLGVYWADEEKGVCKYLDKPYLHCGRLRGNGLPLYSKICISYNDTELEFKTPQGNLEFDFANDCLIEECKWPNLKKLIEDKIPLKFRIKDERHDREFQEFMFTLDVGWLNTGKCFYSTNYPTTISFGAFYPDQPSKVSLFFNGISSEKFFDFANDCLVEEKTIKRIKFNKTNLRIIEIEKILNKIKEDQ